MTALIRINGINYCNILFPLRSASLNFTHPIKLITGYIQPQITVTLKVQRTQNQWGKYVTL